MSTAASTEENSKVCFGCKKSIEGQILTALGRKYHPEHFVCAKCKNPIKDTKFQQHDGEPYCEGDYTKLFSKKCFSCKKPIKEKIIKALGVEWHEEHFVCKICGKSLAGAGFHEKDGYPYCSADYYDKFGDKCFACKTPIMDQSIVALNQKWHNACFKCLKCKKPIAEDRFSTENGNPVCSKCS